MTVLEQYCLYLIIVSIKTIQYNYLIVERNNQEHKRPVRLPKSDIIKSRTHFYNWCSPIPASTRIPHAIGIVGLWTTNSPVGNSVWVLVNLIDCTNWTRYSHNNFDQQFANHSVSDMMDWRWLWSPDNELIPICRRTSKDAIWPLISFPRI